VAFYPDAYLHPVILGQIGIPFAEVSLYVGSCLSGPDGAGKLGEKGVTRRV